MAERTVIDSAGRSWTCTSAPAAGDGLEGKDAARGQDVVLSCATASVEGPVQLTVGWQWESMAAPGLARLLTQASPPPRR